MRVLLCAVLVACDAGARIPESAPRPPPAHDPWITDSPVSWDVRLGEDGFANMSARDMADVAKLERVFPGVGILRYEPPRYDLYAGTTHVATVEVSRDGTSNKVVLYGPGIQTVAGLQIGDRFADVVEAPAHTCHTIDGADDSLPTSAGAIRCWVGEPAHFRYVAYVDDARPARVAANLDDWIVGSGASIGLIIWDRIPVER